MSSLPEKLRLKGLAEEDIYFAKRDRELIGALRSHRKAREAAVSGKPVTETPDAGSAGCSEDRD